MNRTGSSFDTGWWRVFAQYVQGEDQGKDEAHRGLATPSGNEPPHQLAGGLRSHDPQVPIAQPPLAPTAAAEPSSAFCSLLPMSMFPLLAQQIVAPSKGYYLEIPLVLGLTGLVVFAVCRSSRRQ